MGKAVLFSEYGERPPAITIYMRPVEQVNRPIRDNDLNGALGLDDVAPLHLAHELYHHLEAKKPTGGAAGHRISTLRSGPIRVQTRLHPLVKFPRIILPWACPDSGCHLRRFSSLPFTIATRGMPGRCWKSYGDSRHSGEVLKRVAQRREEVWPIF